MRIISVLMETESYWLISARLSMLSDEDFHFNTSNTLHHSFKDSPFDESFRNSTYSTELKDLHNRTQHAMRGPLERVMLIMLLRKLMNMTPTIHSNQTARFLTSAKDSLAQGMSSVIPMAGQVIQGMKPCWNLSHSMESHEHAITVISKWTIIK